MDDPLKLVSNFHLFGHTNVKILMVVDKTIRTIESSGGFGIGRVSRLIDGLSRGCTSFSVDTARRNPFSSTLGHPQDAGHISTSFRFDDMSDGKPVIEDYDQIWMFGFHSEGQGPVVTPSELKVLTEWMEDGGGVFATGDHEDLGASMCSGIPRLREMRRWTFADDVPPIGGVNRLDTNRPENHNEAIGVVPMAFSHEQDTTPQKIFWKDFAPGLFVSQPHEVLCHPQLGPIDVMPDHPHEGRVKDISEVNLGRNYDFGGGVSGDDFPSSGGDQPQPTVIADGETFPAPPSDKPYKGDADHFVFPMISVYDGRSVGIKGRIATDSTWHHWFDLNIYELEHAPDNTAWKKISRYFENLAVWLSPPGRFREKCWFINQWNEYPLVEEIAGSKFSLNNTNLEIGRAARQQFINTFGPCASRRTICDLVPKICEGLIEIGPPLRIEVIEEVVFDGIMRGTLTFMEAHADNPEKLAKLNGEELDKLLDEHYMPAIEQSVRQYAKTTADDLQRNLKVWSSVAEIKL